MKPIPGLNGIYFADKSGKIWRKTKLKLFLKKSRLSSNGYPIVDTKINGSRKTYLVHRLVALTYIKNPQLKKEVNHKNSVRADCRAENLEWVTRSENHKHGWRYGKMENIKNRIESARTNISLAHKKNRRLNEGDIKKLALEIASKNFTHKELGIKYKVSRSTVGNIANKKYYREVLY